LTFKSEDIISINRENIRKTKSYVVITRSAFKHGSDDVDVTVSLPGRISKVKLVCYTDVYLKFSIIIKSAYTHKSSSEG